MTVKNRKSLNALVQNLKTWTTEYTCENRKIFAALAFDLTDLVIDTSDSEGVAEVKMVKRKLAKVCSLLDSFAMALAGWL